jgi:hypothetical protein
MDRYALTFTVRPGTEEKVAAILADYPAPATDIDGTSRLLATSVLMSGNHVVRVIEVQGPLPVILRHLQQDERIRQVEQSLNPFLQVKRDLTNPDSAREFFSRAFMTRIVHRVPAATDLPDGTTSRVGVRYPLRPGTGQEFDRLLSLEQEEPLPGAAAGPTTVESTSVFRKDDLAVRLIVVRGDVREALEHMAASASPAPSAAALQGLLDTDHDLTSADGFGRFLSANLMRVVTDRTAELSAR